jgi:serine/threonine-protein kinase
MMQKGTPTTDRIGAYRVIRELSVTGSIQVHLACEDAPDAPSQNVELKVVPNAPGRDAKDTQKLIRDLTVCSRLKHPGIVLTRKVFKHADAAVLVVEHVDGVSPAELLGCGTKGERPLSDDAALLVGLSICDALAHAHATLDDHRVPIVHRAVSPSNILVGRDGSVKLDGFGFANVYVGIAAGAEDDTAWTPAYMAPEQVTEQAPTPKVDVYAAALILWELLSGRKSVTLPRDPFAIEETLKVLANRKLEPLAKLRPDLPEALTSAVDAALASEADKRNIGCAEMGRCIRKVFQYARGRRELRDCVTTALARPSRSERRASRIESTKQPDASVRAEPPPAVEPKAPASAPRMAARAPRATARAKHASTPPQKSSATQQAPATPRQSPTIAGQPVASASGEPEQAPDLWANDPFGPECGPLLPASAPREPEGAPEPLASDPCVPIAASRAMQRTLVGIAPPPLEVAAARRPGPLPLPVNLPPPEPNDEPNLFDSPLSEPIAIDDATEDADDRAAVLPPFPRAFARPSDDVAVTPASMSSDVDRPSGPHSARLALTADKLPALPASDTSDASSERIADIPQRRRSPWVAAWVVLALSLGGLIVKISSSRAPIGSMASLRTLMFARPDAAAAAAKPAPVAPSPPPVATAPQPVAPSPPPVATAPQPVATAPSPPTQTAALTKGTPAAGEVNASDATSPPPPLDESTKKSLLKRGLGLLTVHSTAPHASVYVNLKVLGSAEEMLTVPCGKQFVSIGIPPRRPGPPIWLAPGKSIIVPCGAAFEATLNPRALR